MSILPAVTSIAEYFESSVDLRRIVQPYSCIILATRTCGRTSRWFVVGCRRLPSIPLIVPTRVIYNHEPGATKLSRGVRGRAEQANQYGIVRQLRLSVYGQYWSDSAFDPSPLFLEPAIETFHTTPEYFPSSVVIRCLPDTIVSTFIFALRYSVILIST